MPNKYDKVTPRLTRIFNPHIISSVFGIRYFFKLVSITKIIEIIKNGIKNKQEITGSPIIIDTANIFQILIAIIIYNIEPFSLPILTIRFLFPEILSAL